MNRNEQLVFGLDIGTRSIVGTVGYMSKDRFCVICQHIKEHETRSMLDGQIHDISRVAETIKVVKAECEASCGQPLKQVCIAAAGRVLQTLNTRVDMIFEENRETLSEDVSNLMSLGVEKAYREFVPEISDMKYYCVGYSVVNYYLNNSPISNLVGHKANQISADIIATFLPDDVVDGLYKAVELAGLEVANLTLEPIAAISVAIPEKFRMLNIALVDVGAGTSDISITRDGSIVAYGMIPMAGDAFTEKIALHCLVDFDMAEKIKRASGTNDVIEYEDIMFLPQTITKQEVLDVIAPEMDDITTKISDEIMRLNGDKPVSAVFVVGGGGIISGFTEALSKKLGIMKERVALRGGEIMGKIDFLNEDAHKTSLMVTPIGICLNYYEHSNNLIYVSFNGKRIKMYDNGHVTVVDVARQAEFPNDGLLPKRGKALTYSVNGKSRIVKGMVGEAAVITINDASADITRKVSCNDKIVIKESTAGVRARFTIGSLPEFKDELKLSFEGKNISVPRQVTANGKTVTKDYEISEDDRIEILDYITLSELKKFLDMESISLKVNGQVVSDSTKVYENFTIETNKGGEAEAPVSEPEHDYKEGKSEPEPQFSGMDSSAIIVKVNGKPVQLFGKKDYIFVDIFEFIDFDLSNPKGSAVVTNHNGSAATYTNPLKHGDDLEIYWKD